MDIIRLKTSRDTYDKIDAARYSMTVEELIRLLSEYPSDAKVIFSNDNGYTYGYVNTDCLGEDFGIPNLTGADKSKIEMSFDESVAHFIDAGLLSPDCSQSEIIDNIENICHHAGLFNDEERAYALSFVQGAY